MDYAKEKEREQQRLALEEKKKEERDAAKRKLKQKVQAKQKKTSSSDDGGGWNIFKAVSNFFQDEPSEPKKAFTKPSKKPKTSVPSPRRGQQFSPYEACKILERHERDPDLDKPAALRILLNDHYVPVRRTQLYRVYKMYEDGKIAPHNRWGQYD